jgi:hypothetical protein
MVIIASGLYIFHRERRLQRLARLDDDGT